MTDRRCAWALSSDAMAAYHDTEWGRPAHDDRPAIVGVPPAEKAAGTGAPSGAPRGPAGVRPPGRVQRP